MSVLIAAKAASDKIEGGVDGLKGQIAGGKSQVDGLKMLLIAQIVRSFF